MRLEAEVLQLGVLGVVVVLLELGAGVGHVDHLGVEAELLDHLNRFIVVDALLLLQILFQHLDVFRSTSTCFGNTCTCHFIASIFC